VRRYYIGPDPPANASAFTDLILANAGEALPGLFSVE